MDELLIFYGMLAAVVGAGLAFSYYLYHKHGDKHDHHSSHG